MKKIAPVLAFLAVMAVIGALNLQARRDGREIEAEMSVLSEGLMCASAGCHEEPSSTLNTIGSVSLDGLPEVYIPGVVYPLSLQIEGSQQSRVYGFQLAALLPDSSPAGLLQSTTIGTTTHSINGVPVLLHTEPLDEGTVVVNWRAPVEPEGEVRFKVAANAANDDLDPAFDHINTLELTVEAPAAAVESYFAQVGDGVFLGDGANIRFTTSLILVNSGNVAAQVQVDFFTSAGDPLMVQLGELGPDSSFEIDLAAGSGFSAETAGTQALAVGYMRLTAPPSVGGTAVFRRSLADSGVALFETGVPASTPLASFSLFVDQRGARRTGLALVNAGAEEAQVTLRLFDLAGMEQSGSPAEIMLAPGEHRPRFADELIMGLPVDFEQGVMQVESSVPLAAVTLRQEDDSLANPFPASVPLLTAFPVLER